MVELPHAGHTTPPQRAVHSTLGDLTAREWEARALAVPVGECQMQEWDCASDSLVKWTYERSEGTIAYALKQAAVFRDVAARLKISRLSWSMCKVLYHCKGPGTRGTHESKLILCNVVVFPHWLLPGLAGLYRL
jgi:hypothetical protein